MKALVLKEYCKLEYTDVPDPVAGDDEVLLKIGACSICGGDVHGYDGKSGRRIPPMIMGHEAAGEIVALGKNVSGYAVGERVTFDTTISCGTCWFCKRGMPNLCDNSKIMGVSLPEYRNNGAMSEYFAVPARILYRLPEGLPYEQAVLVEPLAVALHAVNLARLALGDKVLIVGAGTIGLMLTLAARQGGAGRIIISDLDPAKLALARTLGATHTVLAGDNAESEIRVFTDGRGVDCSFEAVGIGATISLAINSVRKGGTAVLVGQLDSSVTIPVQQCVMRQVRLQGSCISAGEFESGLELMGTGRIDVSGMISKVAPLREGAEWFSRLHAGEKGLIKVVLKP